MMNFQFPLLVLLMLILAEAMAVGPQRQEPFYLPEDNDPFFAQEEVGDSSWSPIDSGPRQDAGTQSQTVIVPPSQMLFSK
jgi:hypothetical protein